jgi:thioredoxin-like negative regulator of GroEL
MTDKLLQQIDADKGLIAYFYSDRCAPCISLRPKVSQMVDTHFTEMNLVFINSEEHPETTGHFGVFANPTIIVFFEGNEFRRYSKYISINELGGDVERVYEMVFEGEDTIPASDN